MDEQPKGWIDRIKALITENPDDTSNPPVGTIGRARFQSMDDRVSQMETGRKRDGQSSDKSNGYK